MMRSKHWILVALLALFVAAAGTLRAAPKTIAQTEPSAGDAAPTSAAEADQESNSDAAKSDAPSRKSFFEIVFSGGLTGFLIVMLLLLLSIAAVALVIENIISIRAQVLMPQNLAEQVQAQLLAGQVPAAEQLCSGKPSFLAFVLSAGISEVDGGWSAVEKAMEDAAAEQSARLFRKVEYLSVIGNIAPMIGLLGTVTGMIFAFQELASQKQGAAALAEGIYQALVTTVGGLIVAIPSLAAFAVFRNRVDQLVAEGSYMALQVFAPLKRRRARKGGQRSGSSAAGAGTGVEPPVSSAVAPHPPTAPPPVKQPDPNPPPPPPE